jgi:3-keto-L-gulonate-6-phosphate decarboxylase
VISGDDVARGEQHSEEHERHLEQFGVAHTYAWHEKRDSDAAKSEPSAKDKREVNKPSSKFAHALVAGLTLGLSGRCREEV